MQRRVFRVFLLLLLVEIVVLDLFLVVFLVVDLVLVMGQCLSFVFPLVNGFQIRGGVLGVHGLEQQLQAEWVPARGRQMNRGHWLLVLQQWVDVFHGQQVLHDVVCVAPHGVHQWVGGERWGRGCGFREGGVTGLGGEVGSLVGAFIVVARGRRRQESPWLGGMQEIVFVLGAVLLFHLVQD
jgi:hypothetical protein